MNHSCLKIKQLFFYKKQILKDIRRVLFLPFILLVSCQSQEEIRHEQMIVNGKELYEQHCANCHQKNGSGVGSLYPPLANNANVLKNKNQLICIIKNGMSGEISVNGKIYNQEMPANRQLFDLDIASIVTYLQARWGAGRGKEAVVGVDDVRKSLETCKQ